MKFFLKLLVATSFFIYGTVVHADMLAGVGWADGEYNITCYLFNGGSGPVNFISKSIYSENGSKYSLGSDTCGTSLTPGRTCYFTAIAVNNNATACQAVLSPSGADVRGELELRDVSGHVLSHIVLH